MWQEQWETLLEKSTLIPPIYTTARTGPEPQKIFSEKFLYSKQHCRITVELSISASKARTFLFQWQDEDLWQKCSVSNILIGTPWYKLPLLENNTSVFAYNMTTITILQTYFMISFIHMALDAYFPHWVV